MTFAVWIGFEVSKFVLIQILYGAMKSDVFLTGYLASLLSAAITFLIFIIVFRKYLPSPRRHYEDKTTMWKVFLLCVVIGISKLFAQRIINIPLLYMGDLGASYTQEMVENVLESVILISFSFCQHSFWDLCADIYSFCLRISDWLLLFMSQEILFQNYYKSGRTVTCRICRYLWAEPC